MHELAHLDALDQAELVRRRDVTPLELVEAAIARIERLNPHLNAVIRTMYDQARAAAAGPLPYGPLAGVPTLLKDLGAPVAGLPMTSGARALQAFVPPAENNVVRRLRAAGLIAAGKTNTPEFGLLPTTEPALFGPTRNPWDTNLTSGGSSGGSAAAVAAGMVPIAHANDGGGSIRIPASCCGLFGLKPSRGRVSAAPLTDGLGLGCTLAISRTVRDSAAWLDVLAGPEPGDLYLPPAPERPFLQEVGRPPGKLRIAFTPQAMTGAPVHPDCVAAVHDAAALLAELGHEVVEGAPSFDVALLERSFRALWAAGCAGGMANLQLILRRAPTPDDVEPATWGLAEQGRRVSAVEYQAAVAAIQAITRQVAAFHLTYDLFLTPTLAQPPLPLGSFQSTVENPTAPFEQAGQFIPFTPLQNATGQPAMSVPLYWNAQGLPVGVHFVARYGDEATLFRLAGQLEQARPWRNRKPAVTCL